MNGSRGYPLDYRAHDYVYVERPNSALLDLVARHVLSRPGPKRVLDIGAGTGANASALASLGPHVEVVALEPNVHAVARLRERVAQVFEGSFEQWLAAGERAQFDGVILSDVLEHVENPVRFQERVRDAPGLERATLCVSVPNYAVWYNRLLTLAGRFDYTWSGLYDRTHLRFFTRASLRRLFDHLELEIVEQTSTPSLVQSLAPFLRRYFEEDVARGEHHTLEQSEAFRVYSRYVEPLEARVCAAWPSLLGFQIVTALRRRPAR